MPDLRSLNVTTELFDYVVSHSSVDPVYDQIRDATLKHSERHAGMQIGADQFVLLTLLTRLVDARFAVEVGTFTGTSAAAIAKGLAPGGRLLCCDVSEEWTSIARRNWAAAGLADLIELRLAPGLETISTLPPEPRIDLAFLDADKGGYLDYYEELVPRIRPGGLLIADNTLWSGDVIDPAVSDANTTAIKGFNDRVAGDVRCESVILTVGDGVTICLKR